MTPPIENILDELQTTYLDLAVWHRLEAADLRGKGQSQDAAKHMDVALSLEAALRSELRNRKPEDLP